MIWRRLPLNAKSPEIEAYEAHVLKCTLYGADMQVMINGIDTRYVLDNESGGPWLTFIHQLAGDLSVWDQQAGYFQHDFQVLRYDLRGHGNTALSAESFDIKSLSDDLAELLDKLGAKHTHVVGLSIGGMVAQQFATDHADKLDSLTVVGAPAFTPQENRASFEERALSVRKNGTASIVDTTLERWLTADFRNRHPEVVEQIGETIACTSSEGFARAAEAVRTFDVRDSLASVEKPTLVVSGKHDNGTPTAVSKRVSDLVPGARLEILDAAHLSPIEQAQRFTALLEALLRQSV
jgi:3-oxoadipate enol-lactonase